MGMFDYVKCELLGLDLGSELFTSSDTQEWCQMRLFTITTTGRLIKHDYDTEATPDSELRYPNEPSGSLLGLCGMIRKRAGSDRLVDQNRDGDLHFDKFDKGFSYRATFRRGDCVEVCIEKHGEWLSIWQIEPESRMIRDALAGIVKAVLLLENELRDGTQMAAPEIIGMADDLLHRFRLDLPPKEDNNG